jgi:transcriptional regulator with XRE-family HTH domain
VAKQNPEEWIAALRGRLGLSRERFAARVGVTAATVARWEAGRQYPQLRFVTVLDRLGSEHGLGRLPAWRSDAAKRYPTLAEMFGDWGVEALPARLRGPMESAMRATHAYEALGPEATDAERAAAAEAFLAAGLPYLRELAKGPPPGERAPDPATRRGAVRTLLETRAFFRAAMPSLLPRLVRWATSDPDDPAADVSREEWEYARATLTESGLLLRGELENFPAGSLIAIAIDRWRRWEETGDPRG